MRFERRSFGGRRFGNRSFGDRRFEQDSNIPKPINVGEEYDVEISEVGSKGDGIARIKNFVVFVANGKKGEKTKIKIKEVRDRFAIGEKVGEATAEATVEKTGEEETETESEETEVTEGTETEEQSEE
ncbi:TRAM domain-containing protein [archaeon]|nr:TRAM domain-containing protein [archaeon]